MTPDELLAGPRGRRLCWELASSFAPNYMQLEPALIGPAVAEARERLSADGDARMLLQALRASVDSAMYWQPPDEVDVLLADPANAEALRTLANVLVSSGDTDWWSTGMQPADQTCVLFSCTDDQPAPLSGVVEGLRELHDEMHSANQRMRDYRRREGEEQWAMTGSAWWSPPVGPRITSTTRSLSPFGPLGLYLVEDFGLDQQARSWPITTSRAPRVYEIGGPADWSALVTRYPIDVTYARGANWLQAASRDGDWQLPDWHAVSADYDAVHLTVTGYLTTSGRIVSVSGPAASFIAGWAPDETYWLADILIADDPTEWTGTDYGATWQPTIRTVT